MSNPGRVYTVVLGLVLALVLGSAALNTLSTDDDGVLGLDAEDQTDLPLPQFALPEARSRLEGDANIAQDDCEISQTPCPSGRRRTPACKVRGEGVIRVCDLFDRPLVISFWFTRGGGCEAQQDVVDRLARRYRGRVGFLSVNVRDDRRTVRRLIDQRGWRMPVGHDRDGAASNVYRVGGCPTLLYAYPGGTLADTSIGELDEATQAAKVDELIAASRRRAERSR